MPVTIRDVFALTKPRLSAQVILTAGGGMFLAPGRVDPLRCAVSLLAMAMVVGAANAGNCYLERDLDRYMRRTSKRPLPAGRLEPWVAVVLSTVLAAIALPLLAFVANPLSAALALTALLSYVAIYTPMKQRSPLSLWVGAVPGAIPPLMGWTAVRGRIEVPGLVLFAVLFFWQLPHFIAVGLFRKEEYARAGHKILTLAISERASKVHALIWTLALLPCTLALTPLGVAGWLYFVLASLLGAGLLCWVVAGFFYSEGDHRWARGLFFGSLGYLTLLFAALMFDAH